MKNQLNRQRLMEMAGIKYNPLTEGIEVVEDEGEMIQPISDVNSSADLQARLEKEPENYQDAWAEIAHFATVIGDDPNDDELFKGLEKYPVKTYAEWVADLKQWADQ
jgi:hypothetical protein